MMGERQDSPIMLNSVLCFVFALLSPNLLIFSLTRVIKTRVF